MSDQTAPTAPGPAGHALVIGEALVDVVQAPGAPSTDIPGGSPANVALGLARLGRQVELDCWIGQDAHGELVRAHLGRDGVRLTPGADGAERTSTALARIGQDRAATYTFDVDWNPPAPSTAGPAPLLVHTGSIAAVLAPGAATVRDVLATCRATSTTCYDPNIRPQLMGEADTARPLVEELIALSDLVKSSDEDIAWLYGTDKDDDEALDRALDRWLELGAGIVVVTRGKRGALARTADGVRVEVPADPAVVVADTVGAGDSFMGGLEDGLWGEGLVGGGRREALRHVDAETLTRVVRHAARIADITVSRKGANPPRREEL